MTQLIDKLWNARPALRPDHKAAPQIFLITYLLGPVRLFDRPHPVDPFQLVELLGWASLMVLQCLDCLDDLTSVSSEETFPLRCKFGAKIFYPKAFPLAMMSLA